MHHLSMKLFLCKTNNIIAADRRQVLHNCLFCVAETFGQNYPEVSFVSLFRVED